MTGQKQNFQFDDVHCSPIPEGIAAKAHWGELFSREWGIALRLPYGNTAAVFMDKRLRSGNYEMITEAFSQEANAAHIISCEGKEWVVKTEPIGNDLYGITVYTSEGKALMAGTCQVQKNGEWKTDIKTLYPGIRNAKKHKVESKCTGKSDGSVECTVGGSIEW